jgi:hypothetical protein
MNNKQPDNSVQYEYQSWLIDHENVNLIGNMGDNLTISSSKNNYNNQPENQGNIIVTQLYPLIDEKASNYEQKHVCK